MKTCYKCHQTKPLDEFPEDELNTHLSLCALCTLRVKSIAISRGFRARPPDKARESRKACNARRNHIKLLGDDITRLELWVRDKGICGICNLPVTRGESFEMDHIVPLSKGGTHTWPNVQVAHPDCNRLKGTKSMQEYLSMSA